MIPAIVTVQSKAALGTLRDAFGSWKYRTRQERQAAAVDQMKILKEALTVWRCEQRSRIITAHIDHRIVSKNLHSLLLRKADVLFHRHREMRQGRAILELEAKNEGLQGTEMGTGKPGQVADYSKDTGRCSAHMGISHRVDAATGTCSHGISLSKATTKLRNRMVHTSPTPPRIRQTLI